MPSVNATWLWRCSKSPMAMGVSTTETSQPMFDFHGSGTPSVRWLPRSLVRVSPSCRSTRRYNKQNRTHLVIQQSLPCLSVCVCVCTSVRWPPRSLVRVSPSCRSTRRYNKQNRPHLVIQQSLPCLSVCVCVYLRQMAAQIPGQSLAQLSLYTALQQAEQNALSYTAVTSMSVCLCVCVCVCTSVRWPPRSLVRVSPSCRSTRRYNKQNRTHLVIQQSLPCLSVCVCVCTSVRWPPRSLVSLAQLSLYAALQQAEQNALSYTAVSSMSVCLCVCVYLRQMAAQIPGQSLAQLSLYAAL